MDIGIDEIIGVSHYPDPDKDTEGALQVSDLIPAQKEYASVQDSPQPSESAPSADAESRKKNLFWKIFAICAAVVIMAVGVYALFRFLSNRKKAEP